MIYQKIFGSDAPFMIRVSSLQEFPEHRHGDLEFNFAIDGEFDIMIEKQLCHVPKGSMSFVHSMEAHAIPKSESLDRKVVILIVGTSLLKKHFSELSSAAFPESVYDLTEHPRITELFLKCASLAYTQGAANELMAEGYVLLLLGAMIEELASKDKTEKCDSDLGRVENIERALDLIYYNYKEQITVEDAARVTGYSKSNFCKIFKLTVGEGFHQALNRQRVSNAAALLKASATSIADVAAEVGFTETKAFCRVFKSIMGVTPGQYRRAGDK